MSDPTEAIRREQVVEINSNPGSREALEAKHGQVWDTQQLREHFEVLGFMGTARCRPSPLGPCQGQPLLPAQSPLLLRLPGRLIRTVQGRHLTVATLSFIPQNNSEMHHANLRDRAV